MKDFLPRRVPLLPIYTRGAVAFIITALSLVGVHYYTIKKDKFIIDQDTMPLQKKRDVNNLFFTIVSLLLCWFVATIVFRITLWRANWAINPEWLTWEVWFKGMWPFPA